MSEPRASDLAYFGKATASISHELKNVVAIINEAAGLLGDLAAAADRGRPLEVARVRKISEEIGRNVVRGVETINRLSRFAHSVDETERIVDLTQLVSDTLAVAGRYPGLRDLSLESAASDASSQVRTDPFRLHRALVLALRLAASGAGPATVRAEILKASEAIQVRFGRGMIPENEDATRALAELQAELGALGGAELGQSREAVILTLPRAG